MSRGQEEVPATPSCARYYSFNCWVWGKDSQGGGTFKGWVRAVAAYHLASSISVFSQPVQATGVCAGGIASVLFPSHPWQSSSFLQAASPQAASPAFIPRAQLVPGVEITALLFWDNSSAWHQAAPVVQGFLRKLGPGLYYVSQEDIDSATIANTLDNSRLIKIGYSISFSLSSA